MNPDNPFESPFDKPESSNPNPWDNPKENPPPPPPPQDLNQQNVNQQYGYNEQQPQFFQGQMGGMAGGNQNVPSSTGVLVLGIVGIVFCGLIGMICAIIALILANSGQNAYRADPGRYSLSSYKNLRAGRTCAIIGLCLQGLILIAYVVYFIVIFAVVGSASGASAFD